MTSDPDELRSCACCGLPQRVPEPTVGLVARCPRCHTTFAPARRRGDRTAWTAAAALSALLVYPLAIGLPVLEVDRLGHSHASSVGQGALELLRHGSLFAGAAVLLCSVVTPLLKLVGLLSITLWPERLSTHARARTWHFVEWVGRWGMLDVVLVALLVAFLKLGDVVRVTPGPGLAAFTALVGLSLLASACYDPHALWNRAPAPPARR